ncbi:PREDICTED: proline-rich protein 3-like [Myotis brandtii]|uniref:proline-rich protein 3-like n=1 Tax=Myotis brandtii TaxID=109478 RepID=UPI000704087A|nr:PREDICTED: proline-rich protein 3-like [Myotis brandtii]
MEEAGPSRAQWGRRRGEGDLRNRTKAPAASRKLHGAPLPPPPPRKRKQKSALPPPSTPPPAAATLPKQKSTQLQPPPQHHPASGPSPHGQWTAWGPQVSCSQRSPRIKGTDDSTIAASPTCSPEQRSSVVVPPGEAFTKNRHPRRLKSWSLVKKTCPLEDEPQVMDDKSNRPVCRHFAKKGRCRCEDLCAFYHPGVNGPPL